MDELRRINFLQKYFNILFKMCAMFLLEDKLIFHPYYVIELIVPFAGAVFYIYNLQLFWDDFEYVCYSTIIAAPLVGGVFRIIFWPVKRHTVASLYYAHFDFCNRFCNMSQQRRVVDKYVIFINVIIILLLFIIVAATLAIFMSPIIIYLLLGESMVLPIPLYIAGINFKTHPGYEINYLWQALAIYETSTVFSLIQTLVLLFIGASTMQVEVLRTKVYELENTILLNLNDNERSVKAKFAEIIDLHNEILEYADQGETMLSFQYFLDVTTLTVLVVISLFYARLANWIPGYGLAIVVLFGAFMNYALGELNCIQLGKLNEAAYNISWYRMSIKMQKMHLIFLQRTLNQTIFTCGGLRPINVDLFASFCNSVYSYLLVLDNLLSKMSIGK